MHVFNQGKWIAAIVLLFSFNSLCQAATEDEKWEFAFNAMIHVLHHEIGHALIDQFEIPVIGQEEDAADGFATVAVLETYDDPQPILLDAAASWFAMHAEQTAEGYEPTYFDLHDLNIQRAYRIICVAHGYDPNTFAAAAKEVELPEDRLETCVDDADQAVASWDKLLSNAYRNEDGPGGKVTLSVVALPEFSDVTKRLDENGAASEITKWLDETYNWPKPITVTFDTCGEENAFYDPSEVKVIMCYEFITYLRGLADTFDE